MAAPAPAAAPVAKAAGSVLGRAAGGRVLGGPPGGDDGGGGPGPGVFIIVLVLAVPGAVVVGIVVLVGTLAGGQQQCGIGASGTLPPSFTGPGSLGGVGGTGVSRALVKRVRSASPFAGPKITPGTYGTTAYGPPWGGIQGRGITTSGGLPILGGAPRWYMVAVDPRVISRGTFVYIWPNPFAWRGPFFAADTGGAIQGRRIDFYDWRGRATQLRWALRQARVSASPVAATSGATPDLGSGAAAPVEAGPGSADCAGESLGSLATPGRSGKVTVAPGADRPGVATKQPVLDFLAGVAGVFGDGLVVSTGSNHSELSSSGQVSDHWIGMAADLGTVANQFAVNGDKGTRLAAAALVAAGVPEATARATAAAGGGHNVCYRGWRVQVIWRTGDHYDHVHVGLKHACSFRGIETFQI